MANDKTGRPVITTHPLAADPAFWCDGIVEGCRPRFVQCLASPPGVSRGYPSCMYEPSARAWTVVRAVADRLTYATAGALDDPAANAILASQRRALAG